uniref:Uncharacterized protein n=1 Tax=viral metagenome TaxID=1070528 RepID=A0A6C0CNA8_9ZZZZ
MSEINDLLEALENDGNSSIMKLTHSKIKQHKNDILQQLQLPKQKLKTYHKKLKEFRYCSEMSDLQYGYYIRWIPIKDPEKIKLTNGAVIADIKIQNSQIQILCKNFKNMFFQIKFDECIVFQKISEQEHVILSVLDYLEK